MGNKGLKNGSVVCTCGIREGIKQKGDNQNGNYCTGRHERCFQRFIALYEDEFQCANSHQYLRLHATYIESNFEICFSTARELIPVLYAIALAGIEGAEMTKPIISYTVYILRFINDLSEPYLRTFSRTFIIYRRRFSPDFCRLHRTFLLNVLCLHATSRGCHLSCQPLPRKIFFCFRPSSES